MKKTIALAAALLVSLASGSVAAAHADEPPAPPTCSKRIGFIGDSLTYQGGTGVKALTKLLTDRGYNMACITIDSLTGRGIDAARDVVKAWRTAGTTPDVFVFALGSNNLNASDKALKGAVDDLLADVGTDKPVHWIGLAFPDSKKPENGSEGSANYKRVERLRSVLEPRPRLNYYDWNTVVHGLPQDGLWKLDDPKLVHMLPPGYTHRNAYVADILLQI